MMKLTKEEVEEYGRGESLRTRDDWMHLYRIDWLAMWDILKDLQWDEEKCILCGEAPCESDCKLKELMG